MTDTAIVKLDAARSALLECKTVMEAKRIADEAERESENLWRLKSLWKKTNKRDRLVFVDWINTTHNEQTKTRNHHA